MEQPTIVPLLERRLIFVLGKGGVGRTTIAAALGLLASRRGARTVVAEVSARGELPELFGVAARTAGVEVEVAPGLWTIQVDVQRTLHEYLRVYLPLRMLADVVGATRLFGYLAAATPGLRELLNAGKVWELAQTQRRVPGTRPYDLVIVDAPASAHALGLLTAPRSFARTAQAGPIARQGGQIDAMLHDAGATALIGVARPADAAVSELLELRDALREQAELELDLVALNATPPGGIDRADAAALEAALRRNGVLHGQARAAVERALTEDRGRRAAAEQALRLERGLGSVPLLELPAIYAPIVGVAEIETLARQLAEAS